MDSEIKVYRDTFKKDISFWIYVKIRYENFHCSVIVDNMKADCVLLEKLQKLQRIVHVLCALCALGFKKDGKLRTLKRYITQRSIPVWVMTSRHTELDVSVQTGYISTGIAEIYSFSITGSDIHYRMLATMVLLTFLFRCCVMTQQEGIMQDVHTFAGTDQCQLPEYGPYSYICKSTY